MTGLVVGTGYVGEGEVGESDSVPGFRSYFGFWFGGLAMVGASTGQPIILRTATIPFLGGSLRRGGW